jgi:hypothetical protein
MQQAAIEDCAGDFDALGDDEAALELPRRDAAVQIDPLVFFGLLSADG